MEWHATGLEFWESGRHFALLFVCGIAFESSSLLACFALVLVEQFHTNKMEAIKKKMANLRETLAEAEEKADKAERELKDANDRAANVSRFHC